MSNDSDALARAEQAEVAEELVATMRHDIRNKLASARQAGHYLKTKTQTTPLWESDPRVARFFAIIDDQLGLIDGALQRHEAFDRVHRRSPTELDPRDVASAALAASSARDRTDTSRVLEHRIRADEHEVVLALRNLLDNAADACSGEITLEGATAGDQYVFAVTDRGEGLTAESFRKYMRPFEGTRPDRQGLGLAVARRIALRYGGHLRLVPQERGSRVELALAVDPERALDSEGSASR